MTVLLPWLLIATGAANILAFTSLSIATARLRAEGRVPRTTPAFLPSLWDPFGAQFFEHVYTDLHRDYRSPLVSGSVWIMRVATPLFLILFVSWLASALLAP